MTSPTVPWNIPLFAAGDTIPSLEGLLNSQSNAMNTALNSLQITSYLQYTTRALMNAAAGTVVGQHATVNADSTPANNGDYFWTGSAWTPVGVAAGFSKTGTQTIANGGVAPTMTTMGTSEFAGNPGFTISSGVFTCTIPGTYVCTLSSNGTTAGVGQYGALMITHNATQYTIQMSAGNNSSGQLGGSMTKVLHLSSGDTVSFQVRQVSGGTNLMTYWVDAIYTAPLIA